MGLNLARQQMSQWPYKSSYLYVAKHRCGTQLRIFTWSCGLRETAQVVCFIADIYKAHGTADLADTLAGPIPNKTKWTCLARISFKTKSTRTFFFT
jgi:hypothetical protein